MNPLSPTLRSLRSLSRPALVLATLACLVATPATADTILIAPNVYQVNGGVEFSLSNVGASNYLFSWSDASGTFTDIADPTLMLVVGETYQFRRVTGAHPFVITDDTLPVSGIDGFYSRETFDGGVIDAATLTPIADFTADPAPTTDFIAWTPGAGDVGNYFYTCRVVSHTAMTGAIEVMQATVANEARSWSRVKSLF